MKELQAKLEIKRQDAVVTKALKALESERITVGYSWELLEKYFNYVYSIGAMDGKKEQDMVNQWPRSKTGKSLTYSRMPLKQTGP